MCSDSVRVGDAHYLCGHTAPAVCWQCSEFIREARTTSVYAYTDKKTPRGKKLPDFDGKGYWLMSLRRLLGMGQSIIAAIAFMSVSSRGHTTPSKRATAAIAFRIGTLISG